MWWCIKGKCIMNTQKLNKSIHWTTFTTAFDYENCFFTLYKYCTFLFILTFTYVCLFWNLLNTKVVMMLLLLFKQAFSFYPFRVGRGWWLWSDVVPCWCVLYMLNVSALTHALLYPYSYLPPLSFMKHSTAHSIFFIHVVYLILNEFCLKISSPPHIYQKKSDDSTQKFITKVSNENEYFWIFHFPFCVGALHEMKFWSC